MIFKQFRKITMSAVLVASITLPSVVKASDTISISLSKAIEIGMSKSATIRIADKEIQRVDYSKKEKFAALFPSINASASYSNALLKPKMYLPVAFGPGVGPGYLPSLFAVDNTFGMGVAVNVPLVSPTLWESLKMTEVEAQQALESARASRIDLINQITKAYYGLLLVEEQYKVLNKVADSKEQNAKIAESKFKEGAASEFEWIRADVEARNAKSGVVGSKNAIYNSLLRLKLLMGLDMNVNIAAEGKLSDTESLMYRDVLSIDPSSVDNNSDLRSLDLATSQLEHALKVNKSQWWPTIMASYNFQYQTMGMNKMALKEYELFPVSNVGVSLSIPIFDGGARVHKDKQLQIQLDEQKDRRESLRQTLKMQILSSLDNIKKTLDKFESDKEGLRQAEKGMQIAQKRYEVGAGVYLDLTNSELAYIQAGLQYNQSIYDYLSAKADLEKLLGINTNIK